MHVIKLFKKTKKGKLVVAYASNEAPTALEEMKWKQFLKCQRLLRGPGELVLPPRIPKQGGKLL